MTPTACPICNLPKGFEVVERGETACYECVRCGRYRLTGSAEVLLQNEIPTPRYRISAVTRQAHERGAMTTLTTDNLELDSFESAVASVRPPDGLIDGIDRALVVIVEKQPTDADYVKLDHNLDYPLVCAPDGATLKRYLRTAETEGLLHSGKSDGAVGYIPTYAGWQRYEQIRSSIARSEQVFVAMWFHDDLDEAYSSGIAPAIRDTGYDPYMVKDVEHNGKIDDLIVTQIRRSTLLVADFTGHRPNVYYEAGLADGLGIPVIRTVRRSDSSDLHFDTRQYSHLVWETPEDLREQLRRRIEFVLPRAGTSAI